MKNPHTLVTDVTTEIDEHGTFETPYGYRVCEGHKLAKIVGTSLFLGDVEIKDYDYAIFKGLIPLWYVVRGENGRFVCGLDLITNDQIWLGETDKKYDSFEELKVDLKEGWVIYLEGEQTL